MGSVYRRGTVWWLKYRANGRILRESSGSTREGDAKGGPDSAHQPDDWAERGLKVTEE